MNGSRFDLIGTWLATGNSRRTTVRALAAGALATGLGGLGLGEAAAKCNKNGHKCRKRKECCSKTCKGGTCRCTSVRKSCSGAGSGATTCCGDLLCTVNACNQESRCSQQSGGTCDDDCDCKQGLACRNGGCCALSGPSGPGVVCCFGVYCNPPGQNCTCIP
jgi:hypothetical protein